VEPPETGRFEGMSHFGSTGSCWRREEGQTMAEYVVVLAIITPAILLALGLFSGSVVNAINTVRDLLS
jgi:Flp pilus assembly pilin Flp